MDAIGELGGVTILRDHVEFARCKPDGFSGNCVEAGETSAAEISVENKDFTATFNGRNWCVSWVWRDSPAELTNTVECYRSVKSPEAEAEFEEEIQRWISEGWLKPWEGNSGGILPLMAVIQRNKGKVRPVLDYRELNGSVQCHSGEDAAVCDETLRKWRKLREPLKLLDLKSAYLQVHVDRKLWKYQLVKHKGRMYCLTRLGFGLKCGPKIMTRIVNEVLSLDERVRRGTDSYIDDIIVNENIISAEEVAAHLCAYGLVTKPPEELEGARVLGLCIERDNTGRLMFRRGNEIPVLQEGSKLSRRKLFSICGKLTGHYPVCGWLRIACSFMKRECQGQTWDDYVGDRAQRMAEELLVRVRIEDPVRGEWLVPESSGGARVYCDASTLALGVTLEIEGRTVEDAAWLRKTTDVAHINIAELDAVLKGLNLALKWNLQTLEIITDSAAVLCWVRSTLTGSSRVRVSGMSEMLVKRRLGLVKEVVEEFDLTLSITLVESCRNKADVLTRVCKAWAKSSHDREHRGKDSLSSKSGERLEYGIGEHSCAVSVEALHAQHHFGVERTLHLAQLVNPEVRREDVERCVRSCVQCKTIDPPPSTHEAGNLNVATTWSRLAVDVTHFGRKRFLTLIDCGPSRFAIWREIESESAASIVRHLEEVFRERGPPDEVLMDNGTAFRSYSVAKMCKTWNVRQRFRAAYRPAGNGIVERHHRTIKRTAARSGSDPLQAVFWYNLAAKSQDVAPSSLVHTYSWRHPSARVNIEEEISTEFQVGDLVAVKPVDGRCTSRWRLGRVTGLTSVNNIEVDGVPRHVLDLRKMPGSERAESEEEREAVAARPAFNLLDVFEEESEEPESIVMHQEEMHFERDDDFEEESSAEQRPIRTRRPPGWLSEFVL